MFDSRRHHLVLSGLILIWILAPASPLAADGGTLRVANVPMGAYRVSVFTDPTPIPPDTLDVSILATFERARGIAGGLEILVSARRTDGQGGWIHHPATREQAEDPRYYAAKFSLKAVGEWEIRVRVQGPEGEGEAVFLVPVSEPGLFSNPYLILGAALLPLVLIGLWLRAGTRTPPHPGEGLSSPSSRPGG